MLLVLYPHTVYVHVNYDVYMYMYMYLSTHLVDDAGVHTELIGEEVRQRVQLLLVAV